MLQSDPRLTQAQNPGQTIVPSAIGFMSTSLGALRLITKSLLSTQPWLRDPEVVEIPWRPEQEIVAKVLCFGVLDMDGMVAPHPPIARGLKIVIQALEKAGHRVGFRPASPSPLITLS